MMVAYVKTASDEKDENKVEGLLTQGKILNRGIKVKNKAVIPFYRLSGDMRKSVVLQSLWCSLSI